MPLSRIVLAEKGNSLDVITDFGFGWFHYDSRRLPTKIDTPRSFHLLPEDFLEVEGQIIAVLGRVIEPGHILDGFELCGLPVPYSETDFFNTVGNYNLLVTPEQARLTGTHPPPHFDSVAGGGYPEFRGYAQCIRRS